ncbi:MAG: hypothetical protein ABW046_21815 [Actinoplanes sp.]
MTRWLTLYARSRRLPVALAASLGAVLLIWVGWTKWSQNREVPLSLTVLTIALALAPLIPTLAGDDDALESTAALRWPRRRVLHLTAGFAVVTLALLASQATGTWFGPAGQIIRDTAGLTGLIGLGAALMGTRMAWPVPISWTAIQLLVGGGDATGWRQMLFWLTQPAGNRVAAITAGVFFVAGAVAYGLRPGPPAAPAEATMGA